MNWYYAEGDQQAGPVSQEELISLVESGRISDETLVWREGMADWKPYGEVRSDPGFGPGTELAPRAPVAEGGGAPGEGGQAICVECGNRFPQSEVITYQGATVCGHCKSAFFQKITEGGAVAGNFTYAGFWIRAVSYILDFIVLVIVSLAVDMLFGVAIAAADPELAEMISFFTQLAIGAAYVTFFLGKYGATPGKMALGLKVVRPDGSGLSYGRAFCRYLAEYLSALILLIGYIIVAFDAEKRALHDHICDTRVIRE